MLLEPASFQDPRRSARSERWWDEKHFSAVLFDLAGTLTRIRRAERVHHRGGVQLVWGEPAFLKKFPACQSNDIKPMKRPDGVHQFISEFFQLQNVARTPNVEAAKPSLLVNSINSTLKATRTGTHGPSCELNRDLHSERETIEADILQHHRSRRGLRASIP